ncbi:MAG: hypothetical protein IT355_20305 [Gemmatimonadaceae bacterium]|nr:hypothetical protein [Gemmatimonadaceae bacterium]
MSGARRARAVHRWISVAFTLGVVANLVAMALESQTVWVGLVALLPLVVLLVTGLYLFVVPYLAQSRRDLHRRT